MTVEIEGLNLEKLLSEAQHAGVRLYAVRRIGPRRIAAGITPGQHAALEELCARFGWAMEEARSDVLLRAVRFCRGRAMLLFGAALCLSLIALSSQMVLGISVTGAQEYGAQVRRFLSQEGVKAGTFKRRVSFDALREGLLLRLPGLSQATLRFAGSVLEIECHLARDGEQMIKPGEGNDLLAAKDGIVTAIVVSQGTPVVRIAEAVYAGQVLIRGEERTAQGETISVSAQGQVTARVWAQGEARASLYTETAQETGRTRTRVTIHTPWYMREVQEAQPFENQNEIVRTERIIDLFIPLWRRTQVFEEIRVIREPRSQTDAISQAQGAAEKLAKKQLPAGVLILDKWVDYSMIDNEYVYASVVLEYEQDIAVRPAEPISPDDVRSMQ